MTITTIPGHTYIVTSPLEVTLSTLAGVIIGTFPPNVQSSFIAPTYELTTSHDSALITQSEDGGIPSSANNAQYALNSDLIQLRSELAQTQALLNSTREELAALREEASKGILSTIWQRVK